MDMVMGMEFLEKNRIKQKLVTKYIPATVCTFLY